MFVQVLLEIHFSTVHPTNIKYGPREFGEANLGLVMKETGHVQVSFLSMPTILRWRR